MTSGSPKVELKRLSARAKLLSPLKGFEEVESGTEYRFDPLTGRVAVIGLNLADKRTVLYSETDEDLLESIATSSRAGCFFCPDRVEDVTPKYPQDVLPGTDGRLRSGGSVLFPNLFPLTDFHAVVALGHDHFLRLDRFSPELLMEGLSLAAEFIRKAAASHGAEVSYWTICGNYLQPGGASIVHPHMQILGSRVPLTTTALELERARAYHEGRGTCYFDDLVSQEEELGERFVMRSGKVAWLAAFAPRGNNELQGICDDISDLTQLEDDHLKGLAEGMSRALATYHDLRMSTFNFAVYSAPVGQDQNSFRVYASIVSRQSVVENYRCDDYFIQKMLGSEIVVDTPEKVAELARAAALT